MSMRLLTVRLVKHGRSFLRSYWSRDIHTNILEQTHLKTRSRRIPPSTTSVNVVRSNPPHVVKNVVQPTVLPRSPKSTSSGLFRVGQHARKLFIDNILNRVTTNYSEALRQKATKKLFYGDSEPFFALIGVGLASGAGMLSKEDELEGVCLEIREATSRLQSSWNNDELSKCLDRNFTINNLDVGPPIAKGCAAVVYAAALKNDEGSNVDIASTNNESGDSTFVPMSTSTLPDMQSSSSVHPEYITPLRNMSRFVHNFGGSVDNLYIYNENTTASNYGQEKLATGEQNQHLNNIPKRTNLEKTTDNETKLAGSNSDDMVTIVSDASINRYPLALKMMFNYDIQSNALSILRAMYKETVPARQRHMNTSSEEWERLVQNQTLTLPPHPNIVCMFGFFCDEVGNFPDGHLLYPVAQPQRINPMGYGRNMSLYLLMKRYDLSLRNLIDTHELNTRVKLLLLAQLLEAVTHINRHGIAHRDLKADNILIELNDDETPPVLVLSDFGCCLADKVHGLQMPFNTYDVDKGGNAALMAPEIINKQPGPFTVLNYAKADLWACGAIAYEIFGLPNPFYSTSGGLEQLTNSLRNNDYKVEDLPPLNESCPKLVEQLIYNILSPNPSKRISPDIAANVLQLFLWAPSKWLRAGNMPNSPEILQWLLSLTTKVMCEGRGHLAGDNTTIATSATKRAEQNQQLSFQQYGRRTYVEYLLICSFLSRARLRRIRGALNWIQSTVA